MIQMLIDHLLPRHCKLQFRHLKRRHRSKVSGWATHSDFIARFRRLVSGQPSGWRELCDSIDREVRQARQDRAKIVPNRDF